MHEAIFSTATLLCRSSPPHERLFSFLEGVAYVRIFLAIDRSMLMALV